MTEGKPGSILGAIFWMIVVSILLFWLPAFGPLIAGIVGGKIAGGVLRGMGAVVLPAIVLGAGIFASATVLTGVPVIGAVAGLGVAALLGIQLLPLLIGAVIGGLLA